MNGISSWRARAGLVLGLGAVILAVPVQSAVASVTGTNNASTVAGAIDPANTGKLTKRGKKIIKRTFKGKV